MKLSLLIQTIAPSLQTLGGMKLPVRVAFRISAALLAIQPLLETFEKSRMSLFEKFGTMDESGTQYSVSEENLPEFNKQFMSLFDEEVAVTLPKIKLSEMGDMSIEPKLLFALSDVFVDE